jgi:hypothetical protein
MVTLEAASAAFFLGSAPIFLGFAFHCRRIWIFDFQPKRRAPPAIGRAEPLRHDTLATELASLAKNDLAILLVMLVEGDARV